MNYQIVRCTHHEDTCIIFVIFLLGNMSDWWVNEWLFKPSIYCGVVDRIAFLLTGKHNRTYTILYLHHAFTSKYAIQ